MATLVSEIERLNQAGACYELAAQFERGSLLWQSFMRFGDEALGLTEPELASEPEPVGVLERIKGFAFRLHRAGGEPGPWIGRDWRPLAGFGSDVLP